MAMAAIRILSDLHFLETACRVGEIQQLRPLIDGASAIIFNGDLIDTQHVDPGHGHAKELKAFFQAHAPTTFITGNHDPDISETHDLLLEPGGVWITHGDIVFENMIPWSREHRAIARRIRKALETAACDGSDTLAHRFAVYRSVCKDLPRELHLTDKSTRAKIARYLYVLFPPRQALALLGSWWVMPGKAARLANSHRPKARCVINGHSHYAGIWTVRPGTTVINTGSYCGPLQAQVVEIDENRLLVRPVIRRGGDFRLGPPVKTFALPAPVLPHHIIKS